MKVRTTAATSGNERVDALAVTDRWQPASEAADAQVLVPTLMAR
jgi:hypothetical protein